MRTTLVMGLVCQTCICLAGRAQFGQPRFELANYNFAGGVDAPVYDFQWSLLAGSHFRAELWGSPSVDSLAPCIDYAHGNSRVFAPFYRPGYFRSSVSTLTVPELLSTLGSEAWLQVRVWDVRLGATYEDVASRGLGGYGESPLFWLAGRYDSPNGAPPAELVGLQSFTLRPIVPEPSVMWLALAGLPVLWWHGRKRR